MSRILIAAYHPVVLHGITQTVRETMPGSRIIGSANTVRNFIALLEEHKPERAVVDVAVTWKCGIDFMEEVERVHPDVDLQFISVHPLDQHVLTYLEKRKGKRGRIEFLTADNAGSYLHRS